MTSPGDALEGFIYRNNSTKETITVYKKTKSATTKRIDGTKADFPSYETLIAYLSSYNQIPPTSANSLSDIEMEIIEDISKNYGLIAKMEHLTPVVKYMAILDKNGQRRFTIRKLKHRFHLYKTVIKGHPEGILNTQLWTELVKAMHTNFKECSGLQGVSEFDPIEVSEIIKLAQHFNLLTNKVKMTMEPDKHEVESINLIDSNGKIVWNVSKDNGTYKINKVAGQTWDLYYDTKDFNAFFKQLEIYLKQGGFYPASEEHKGITLKESAKIKAVVDMYGSNYWAEYVHGSMGQPAYVEIVGKNEHGAGQILYSIGALGNYYQINDSQNKPLETAPTLDGIIARLHDRLASIAGTHAKIDPMELNEIAALAVGDGFIYHEPAGDEPYTYVKKSESGDGESIEVEPYGVVKYQRFGVFGPIYWTVPKNFITWFNNVYKSGKVPSTASQFAERIFDVLDSGGFIKKDTGTVFNNTPTKINAIKALKAYISQVTGGPCGLAKSKWAVENFKQFFDYVREHGLPNMSPDSEEFLTQFKEPPHTIVVEDKLTADEQATIIEMVKKYSPQIKYQLINNSIAILVGNSISYKATKEGGIYRVYTDKNGEWVPLAQANTFEELTAYLDSLLIHIAKAIANSKLEHPATMTTPATDPDKLSEGEVAELKKLIKKFGLPMSTSYTKKLMESNKIPQEAYSVTINDVAHKVQVKISRKEGKYIISKGADDSYYTLQTFDAFHSLLAYLDFFLNSYIKEPTIPILGPEQIEWLETLMKTQKPTVVIKQWPNGVVGGYDPTNKIHGEDNPLFVIRFAPGSSAQRILQVHTEDGGGASDEYPFNTFEAMASFIGKNIEIVTQLLKSETVPESKLTSLMTSAGFQYKEKVESVLGTGGSKHGNVYENEADERLHLFNDGSSRIWYTDKSDGEMYEKIFGTVAELVTWMESHYQSKMGGKLKEMQEYLAYLGFKTDKVSDKWSTTWTKQVGPDHQSTDDYVHLHVNGPSKVTPAPLIGIGAPNSFPFWFQTLDDLKKYLTEKYIGGENKGNLLLADELEKWKFKKTGDQTTEMGYKWKSDKWLIIPFPSGGIIETPEKEKVSFESTYDLAKGIEHLMVYGTGNKPIWTTGDDALDDMIKSAGFVYKEKKKGTDGEKLTFTAPDGTQLRFYTADNTSGVKFPPGSGKKKESGIAFTTVQGLKNYLAKYIATPKAGPPVPAGSTSGENSYLPSGAEYETHSNEANASLIWLNEHDEKLLQSLGFVRTPQHNVLYTNAKGNIVKFTDTGKAQYIDYFGDPDKPENAEVIAFDDIHHALKFMVAKHAESPFSQVPYKSDDGEHVYEIPLNQHDHNIMEQLGFEWNEKGQKYIKFIGPNDKPAIQEATVELDRHEVFTAYDTGNSIWQLMEDDGKDQEEIEVREGSIRDVLFFIWTRWHNQLSVELKGETAPDDKPFAPKSIPKNPIAPKSIPKNPMPSLSGFDYSNWATGTDHSPDSTIKLVPHDDHIMKIMGWGSFQSSDDTYFYVRSNGDRIYFFVGGNARLVQDGKPTEFVTVKSAMEFLWSTANVQMPLHVEPSTKPSSKKYDAVNELIDLGFNPSPSSGDDMVFVMTKHGLTHVVELNQDKNTIDYTSAKTDNPSIIVSSWKESIDTGLNYLKHVFIPPLTEQDYVVEKMKEFGFKIFDKKPVPGEPMNQIKFVRYTPKFMYYVEYTPGNKMMHFTKSNAKMKKGYHTIVDQWTKSVKDAVFEFENLFAYGSLGTDAPKKGKKKKVLAGTEDMPWSGTNYKILWAGQPANTGMILNDMEETTMYKLGWHRGQDTSGPGQAYYKGNEKMRFLKHGKVEYWSSYGMAPSQSWDEVEMPIRWLWKNKKSSEKTNEVPYSGTNYDDWNTKYWPDTPKNASISLKPEDTATMEKIGFTKKVDDTKDIAFTYVYENEKSGEKAYFFASGKGAYWKNAEDGPYYYDTVQELMQMLWNKYSPYIAESTMKDLVKLLTSL